MEQFTLEFFEMKLGGKINPPLKNEFIWSITITRVDGDCSSSMYHRHEGYYMTLTTLGMEPHAPNSTPAQLYQAFVTRCRTYLHVVLALSPIGDAFRRRLRMFPSLVNCCTIDWFTDWPAEALRSVADHFLLDVDVEARVKGNTRVLGVF